MTDRRSPAAPVRLALPALALLLAGALPAPAQVVVKMATLAPDGSTYHLILKEMAEKWKTSTQGRVVVKLYPGSVAGDDTDVVRKMRLGSLNAGLLTSSGVAAVDRSVMALQIPMLYSSYEEIDHVLSVYGPKLEATLAAKGFVVLNWADAGWVRFFTKTPVRTPDEMKPLKLFAWGNDTDSIEIWKDAGFSPVPLPSTEISTALQTGLVSALPAPPQAAVLLQWYQHAKNMTDVKWAVLLGATMIGKPTWDKISPEDQKLIRAAAAEAGARLRAESRSSEDRDIEAMKKRGLNVVAVDGRAEALWRAAAEAAYPKARGRIVPEAAFDEARKILAEFRAKKATAPKK
ncbi:MAG: TRAP transporter substrate-binding protein DctP [Holophagales bacterium]|jgi:TRAP-type C4-dicarboxylate transport system substrate-binding protein|nr:TRAP transporter substrate-binding protein DctP [Holophagales bacterium]MBK9969134.1 TRAP transporter substrate-binding protein DctP [Holophagales bacterium]